MMKRVIRRVLLPLLLALTSYFAGYGTARLAQPTPEPGIVPIFGSGLSTGCTVERGCTQRISVRSADGTYLPYLMIVTFEPDVAP